MTLERGEYQSELLNQAADKYLADLKQVWPEWQSLTAQQLTQLHHVLGLSDFVAEQLLRHPHWIVDFFETEFNVPERQHFARHIAELMRDVHDEEDAKAKLRQYRNQQMVRLAWRDFMGLAPLENSLLDLSVLAESLIIAARDWLYDEMCSSLGMPCDKHGQAQPLMILGMGKLGGRELNFSSDIDLIFTFPEHGETVGGRRTLDNQQFFIRMGQRLVNLLGQVTTDGFVFRVDMRLRPYGESGPLVVSYSALEDYYQEQGREWERYAMVKARALGPWNRYSDQLHDLLRPFIYRRYIDFSAIDSLRRMKQLIAQEVRRRQLTDNIKLGAGGIREVEFVVQSFQLIRGGREPELRCQSIYEAIDALYQLHQMDYFAADELRQSYSLLRRVENLLQAINDKQTQTLPSDGLSWHRLCYATDTANEAQLRAEIEAAMKKIHRHFRDAVGGEENTDATYDCWTVQLWCAHQLNDAKLMLKEHGVEDDALAERLFQWKDAIARRSIGPRGRETLDKLMPKLLEEIGLCAAPVDAFVPVSGVLEQILTRTTYLELLYENPGARQQLISLCSASPWIASELARFPMLLDELIDPAQLYNTTSLDDYASELRQYLLRIPADDMEQLMEGMRQFKLSQQLKIAAADVTGVLPVMQVSDHLTFLAEALIEQVVHYAWLQLTERYGTPNGVEAGDMAFAVVGYGKLGGIELGYGSDLDLVFLHNAPEGMTNGDKQIEVGLFYAKLAQRIQHLFSTRTVSGILYEVDLRLRPSGASGLLVSSIDSFADYQREQAWTWEHQALVRARFIHGDAALAERFADIRTEVLSRSRDTKTLATEVHQMRLKMREHLLKVPKGMFDLKQSPGGIADIEFIAQFLVLAHAQQYHELCVWSDNVRIFEVAADLELLPVMCAQALTQIYCQLRDESHHLTLAGKPSHLPLEEVARQATQVVEIYGDILGPEKQQSE
ncbi:bifunctional [glutamate--ammonia ligase]-adenylyl-L-tyrosine phosphorylase/[glutamate--ammonia-ligase] adenylyltransferase [Shewanella avicenniae]|uniref:Bifunctional glutamine synthetase adenylyltransferase/adenylyl-removing enzyme n=1 Tax=Shewanella avicenniae TaxID=2814294 RepID=A0ABX7QQJ8_9GAMM|nr:bifunctional [glutamate--ammonia ligase]-adenylyl-L-tyrosine phosphorylase/[glutamate--ammonia-ligase] adenylyltransferase [Shewanella avicenniae]QSX32993.1 bifunctional [glutamate--ammonia ligase]-adenylyl-L-tyrosine phosphorylase/[glutamate--ammonia-ligase] adenylyltransferase [Shewanella avicenniae]